MYSKSRFICFTVMGIIQIIQFTLWRIEFNYLTITVFIITQTQNKCIIEMNESYAYNKLLQPTRYQKIKYTPKDYFILIQ